ncbi:MAG: hypothetical protein AAF828_10940 [Bacteroidota bacterium]
MTKQFLLSLVVFFSLMACGSEGTNDQADTPNTATPAETASAETLAANRPTGCMFITDQQVLDALQSQTEATITVQVGPSVSACYYRVDARYWSADLIVEVADGSRADAIIKAVQDAENAERLTVNDHPAIIKNDNRILTVNAGPPYEIKLSILPKPGYKEVKTATDRRTIMLQLADVLEEAL